MMTVRVMCFLQETPWCTPAERSISVAVAVGQTPKWNTIHQGTWLLDTSANFTWDNISEASVINIETGKSKSTGASDMMYIFGKYPLKL